MLTKVLTALAMPLGIGLLLVLAGWLMLLFRWALLGGGLVLVGLVWVWLWATPAFSDWVRGSLEDDYPPLALASLITLMPKNTRPRPISMVPLALIGLLLAWRIRNAKPKSMGAAA